MPEIGERGIYFVESLQRRQVHPLYGWSQGHFLVMADERGVERVLTRAKRPVSAMGQNLQRQKKGLSSGAAQGLVLAEEFNLAEAMTITDFKQQLLLLLPPKVQ